MESTGNLPPLKHIQPVREGGKPEKKGLDLQRPFREAFVFMKDRQEGADMLRSAIDYSVNKTLELPENSQHIHDAHLQDPESPILHSIDQAIEAIYPGKDRASRQAQDTAVEIAESLLDLLTNAEYMDRVLSITAPSDKQFTTGNKLMVKEVADKYYQSLERMRVLISQGLVHDRVRLSRGRPGFRGIFNTVCTTVTSAVDIDKNNTWVIDNFEDPAGYQPFLTGKGLAAFEPRIEDSDSFLSLDEKAQEWVRAHREHIEDSQFTESTPVKVDLPSPTLVAELDDVIERFQVLDKGLPIHFPISCLYSKPSDIPGLADSEHVWAQDHHLNRNSFAVILGRKILDGWSMRNDARLDYADGDGPGSEGGAPSSQGFLILQRDRDPDLTHATPIPTEIQYELPVDSSLVTDVLTERKGVITLSELRKEAPDLDDVQLSAILGQLVLSGYSVNVTEATEGGDLELKVTYDYEPRVLENYSQ